MLKPEASIGVGLATLTVVFALHQNATPTAADVRTLPEMNEDIEKSERAASWLSAGIVGGISLVARDPVIFWIGGTGIIAMAWWSRHANRVNPDLKRLIPGGAVQSEPMPQMTTEEYTAFEGQFASEFAA